MITKLAEKTQELNATLLENIKKDSSIERLSEQLESKPFTLTSFLYFFGVHRDTSICLSFSETKAELEQSQMAREQAVVELGMAKYAQRKSEEARKVNIEELTKLVRVVGAVMTGLGVPFGLMLPDRLVEEVGGLPGGD
jgi:hypothetical protein